MTTRYALLPWSAIDYGFGAELIKSADGKELAMRQDGASVADMRLMAAAPELLAALEKEAEWRGREAAGAIDPEWDYETMVGQHRRAAIAKAKGEQA